MHETNYSTFQSIKLISLDSYFNELVNLYESNSFPKVLLLSGKKGIGKFTLILHFLNYVYSKKEKTKYNVEKKLINLDSIFYNSILSHTSQDVIFLEGVKGKDTKIEDVRTLKSTLSKSSLSDGPRFTIIDEVEFLNNNSANALLKTLEEPTKNNYFILINNQQTELIKTISSRCLKNNIYLKEDQRKKIINYFIENKKMYSLIEDDVNLTPGLALRYDEIYFKYKIQVKDDIQIKLNKLLHAFKKDKNKNLINMSLFLTESFFYNRVKENVNNIDFLLTLKSTIVNKIIDFRKYNLNINSVLTEIEFKLKNAR
jgi:DNA polymerase-3 subunit delta'